MIVLEEILENVHKFYFKFIIVLLHSKGLTKLGHGPDVDLPQSTT